MTQPVVMTVTGPISPDKMGHTLIHEHILVDGTPAARYDTGKWDKDAVVKKMLPFLQELKDVGCKTFVDCTPNYVGRDVVLLKRLSELSGLNILTNTGYYGGSNHGALPAHAFTETDRQLADRWVAEWKNGIDGTDIKPGFIKISVNNAKLSDISQKLVRAAALTHLNTGLTITSHTGPAVPAMEEIEIVKSLGVSPSAFIWTHASGEKDWSYFNKAANEGAWVSLDGLGEDNVDQYVKMLSLMKESKTLHRALVSHDAGWYSPGQPDGGKPRGYTTLFKKLVPALKQAGFTDADIEQILTTNPWEAHAVRVRRV